MKISEDKTIAKIAWRLLPLLMLGYFVAFVDRVNVGFASLSMNADIGISSAIFGFGAGLFYITYVIFEIPSNLLLEKIGARIWIGRIMISWGIISACGMFISGEKSFYAIRLLLGVAEAGFFPGIILYITYWFPPKYRAKIIAIFMVAIPLSSFVGSPISAYILTLDGLWGLKDWQLLFLLEGLPAVILGILVIMFLPNKPSDANWLCDEEKQYITTKTIPSPGESKKSSINLKNFFNKRILALSLAYAGASGASQCLSIWQPVIIKSLGFQSLATGFLNALPFGIACVMMILWGRHSDLKNERIWHSKISLFLVMFFLIVIAFVFEYALLVILSLIIAVSATYMFKGPFWALGGEYLPAGLVAFGLAEVNSIGNLAGFIGSWLIGIIRDWSGSFTYALIPIALISLAGCIVLHFIGKHQNLSSIKPHSR
ncbi:MFS transporter [Helicobacter sp. 11S03491-1]|uniref:MFS transporter n=1 Tax=Helicobacter sp. 11S03491-1 TaxID=1476196 RepID=UPI000BA537B1|nr:MFS transporter [Helicobacter sp. 11S03491-1]PAF42052.1 MFS transporter [Helicobacter sp. 11S03491-1]